jgi:hypothetical protein
MYGSVIFLNIPNEMVVFGYFMFEVFVASVA